MKTHALQFDQYGTEATPSWQSVDLPAPTASQVLISVLATAPSAFDLGVQAGNYRDWLPLHFPATYGTEAVGVIKTAGANVDFKPGDIVVGMVAAPNQGAFAKETILDGKSLASLPNGVPVDQGLVELTAVPAYLSLFNIGQLQRDQHVLIQGGAGGVGTMAVQLARNIGAHVTTTSSPADFAQLQELGVEQTLDYHTDITNLDYHFDLVIDTVGGRVLEDSFQLVRDGGRIVSLVSRPNAQMKIQYPTVTVQFLATTDQQALPAVLDLIASGRIQVPIQQRFTLDQAGILAAINFQRTHHVFGRVAIITGG